MGGYRDAVLETYIKKVRMDVEHLLEVNNKRCKNNLLSVKGNALWNLQQQTDIVIKPADEGSTVVMLSKEDYIKEADRQLNNHTYYQKLDVDLTPQYASEIKSFIHSMFSRGQIDKKKLKTS